jgi:hypothetical protein
VILIEGETPQEMAQNLVKALQADKVI